MISGFGKIRCRCGCALPPVHHEGRQHFTENRNGITSTLACHLAAHASTWLPPGDVAHIVV
ncbi:hypothetical protein [Streptodolium elevatio]|uniref:Uncharacterized protein n=1 Tax=Streptodolium elevatio TaxID=3157996 RepID=A0ABV3DUH8_9ACTN